MNNSSPYASPPATGDRAPSPEEQGRIRYWKRSIWVSITMIIVPPMIGLAGTAIGMIRAFGDLKQTGGADPAALARTITEALSSTMFGLMFSVIGLVCLIISIIRVRSLSKGMITPRCDGGKSGSDFP